MTQVICDHCKKPVTDVAYVLRALDAERVDCSPTISGPNHLHWDCIPLFGRSRETP